MALDDQDVERLLNRVLDGSRQRRRRAIYARTAGALAAVAVAVLIIEPSSLANHHTHVTTTVPSTVTTTTPTTTTRPAPAKTGRSTSTTTAPSSTTTTEPSTTTTEPSTTTTTIAAPACSAASIQAGLDESVSEGKAGTDVTSATEYQYGCSGSYAYAFVTVKVSTGPSEGGTDLLEAEGGAWVTVDRWASCDAGSVPAAIYQNACGPD